MRLRAVSPRFVPVTIIAVVLSGGAAARAASSLSLCVRQTPNTAVTSASTTGTCATGSTAVALPASTSGQQTLLSILPDITYQPAGIAG